MHTIAKNIATLGFVGYLPAPGSCASLITAVTLWFLLSLNYWCITIYIYNWLPWSLLLLAHWSIAHCLDYFEDDDPGQIVIDEVVALTCCLVNVPQSLPCYIAAFILFRFFDICKPWPICLAEDLPGQQGIIADDMVAALMSWLVITLTMAVF